MIGKLLGALNWKQVLIWLVGTVGIGAIQCLVPAGNLKTTLLGIDANAVSLLGVLFRTPSTQGGTVVSK